MKKTLLSTALFLGLSTTFISHAATDAPELYAVAIEIKEGNSTISSTSLNIDRNNISAITEDGVKVLGRISSGSEQEYLASVHIERHWVYNFLPWEPEPEYIGDTIRYGDTYSIDLAENNNLQVLINRVELLEIKKFTSGDITIEAPSTQDRTHRVTLSFPKNGERLCKEQKSQTQNSEPMHITVCVSAMTT